MTSSQLLNFVCSIALVLHTLSSLRVRGARLKRISRRVCRNRCVDGTVICSGPVAGYRIPSIDYRKTAPCFLPPSLPCEAQARHMYHLVLIMLCSDMGGLLSSGCAKSGGNDDAEEAGRSDCGGDDDAEETVSRHLALNSDEESARGGDETSIY